MNSVNIASTTRRVGTVRVVTGVLLSLGIWLATALPCLAQQREWSDSTGKFKITGTLVEVQDSVAFLKTTDGKVVKIPIERLSAADQEFLKGGANPFEVVDGAMEEEKPAQVTPAASNAGGSAPWSGEYSVDWGRVDELDTGFGTQWNYQPTSNELDFEAKRAPVSGKTNFFEGMRRLEINPVAKRAVAGYTISFSVPKHLSRVSLIDLPTGKTINSEQVEGCNMCPVAVLNDGNTIIMQGTGSDRDGYETADQLQIWRIRGTKVSRSPIWIPFPNEDRSFGKQVNGSISKCLPIDDKLILLMSSSGHLACFNVVTREPVWHSKLGGNHAMELSTDQQTLFLMSDHRLMVVEPKSGKVSSSLVLEDRPHMGWTRIRLSPAGDKLLLSFVSQLRLIDLATGQVETIVEDNGQGPIAPNGLLFPDPDYALLNNNLLFHLPSRILVCNYQQAAVIDSVGGVEFVGVMDDKGGWVVPTQMPHARAAEILKQAEDDPGVFLIHPGVEVAIDTSGVGGQYRNQVETGLQDAAKKAGYQVSSQASIRLKASISGPTQKAVSYIASGSYIANEFTSTVQLLNGNEVVWSRSGTNVPGIIQTERGQSIQDKLNELGRTPNLGFFGGVVLPKMMQAPQKGGNNNAGPNALLTSTFSTSGLQDSQ